MKGKSEAMVSHGAKTGFERGGPVPTGSGMVELHTSYIKHSCRKDWRSTKGKGLFSPFP